MKQKLTTSETKQIFAYQQELLVLAASITSYIVNKGTFECQDDLVSNLASVVKLTVKACETLDIPYQLLEDTLKEKHG